MNQSKSSLCFCISTTLLLFFFYSTAFAQSKTTGTAGKTVTISINSIEYDDPSFAALKGNIKTNTKAKDIKQSYNAGTAKISMGFSGTATDLWDELPASVKQPFKLNSIDESAIVLQLKTSTAQSSTPKSNTTTTASTTKTTSTESKNNSACTTCYIDLCKYDKLRTFVGVTFIGIDYDDGTYYYRCENGVLIRKLVWVNESGVTTKIETDTVLKVNVPVGTAWGTRTGDAYNKQSDVRMILAKGISVNIDGQVYTDVIVVNRKTTSETNLIIKWENATSLNAYYAKGAGIVKIQQLDPSSDPLLAIQQYKINTTQAQVSTVASTTVNANLKGTIDPVLVGLWKYTDAGGKVTYMKLNADGTSETYIGSVTAANKSKALCYWRIDGSYMESICDGATQVNRFPLQKGYDAVSGKPTLGVSWATYVAADSRASW
jgi:hypothetical protein